MENKIIPAELVWTEGKVKNFFGKDLLALDNGTLKIVKVAPHASYPEHVHPDKTEFVYVLEGEPSFVINAVSYNGKAHEFFKFPKQLKHAILNNTDKECLLLVGAIKD